MDVLYELITKHLSSEYKVVEKEKKQLDKDGLKVNVEYLVLNYYGEKVRGYELCEYISETFGTSDKHATLYVTAWLLRNGMGEDATYLRVLTRVNLDGLFPLIERVQSNLLANDIVAVQPLSAPTGVLTYMDFVYKEESKWKRFWKGCWMRIKSLFIK